MYVCIYIHIHMWTHIVNMYKARSLPILPIMMLWFFILLGLVMVISQIHIGTDLNEKVVCWRSTNGFTIYLSTPKESIPVEFSRASIDLVLENKKHHHKLTFFPLPSYFCTHSPCSTLCDPQPSKTILFVFCFEEILNVRNTLIIDKVQWRV